MEALLERRVAGDVRRPSCLPGDLPSSFGWLDAYVVGIRPSVRAGPTSTVKIRTPSVCDPRPEGSTFPALLSPSVVMTTALASGVAAAPERHRCRLPCSAVDEPDANVLDHRRQPRSRASAGRRCRLAPKHHQARVAVAPADEVGDHPLGRADPSGSNPAPSCSRTSRARYRCRCPGSDGVDRPVAPGRASATASSASVTIRSARGRLDLAQKPGLCAAARRRCARTRAWRGGVARARSRARRRATGSTRAPTAARGAGPPSKPRATDAADRRDGYCNRVLTPHFAGLQFARGCSRPGPRRSRGQRATRRRAGGVWRT